MIPFALVPYAGQHPSYDNCLEVKSEYYLLLCVALCDTMFTVSGTLI